ncbi:MAG: hypothetical protein NTX28_07850 [Novosphingobium sp.]|nr:hypothetical protein [Novosphingobium sp.]
MPRNIEPIHARRAAQLKALAQVRNTLPAPDRAMVAELVDVPVENMQDWQLELVDSLASAYLCEVA